MTDTDKNIHFRTRGRPAGKSNPAYPLTDNQVRSLFGVCVGKHGLRNRAILAFCFHSGARIGTVADLKVEQVVDAAGKVKSSYVVHSSNEKSKRTHRYYLTKEGRSIIQDYVNQYEMINGNPLFKSQKGKGPINKNSLVRLVSKLLRQAGIEDNSSHCGRKTFATKMHFTHKVPIQVLSKWLNHASISQTEKYVVGRLEEQNDIMASFTY